MTTLTEAAVLTAYGAPFEVMTVELRDLRPNEVLVRLDAAAVCQTDTLVQDGFSMTPPPFITGHAGTGIAQEVGSAVTRVRVGDRVVVMGTTECGQCYYCLNSSPGACVEVFEAGAVPRPLGTSAAGEVLAEAGIGIYAQYNIYREGTVVTIDAELPPEHAALLGCGITSGLGAVFSVAGVTPGSSVAISGAGHLGLWMTQAARLAGASTIIVVEPIDDRRELAGALGATHLLDTEDGDQVARVRELTEGRGVDFAFEAAGSSGAMEQSFQMARNGGTVVPTGLDFTRQVTLNTLEYAVFSKRILSSQTGGGHIHRDVPRFARMLEQGLLDAGPIVSATFGLQQINEAIAAARNRDVITGVIVMS